MFTLKNFPMFCNKYINTLQISNSFCFRSILLKTLPLLRLELNNYYNCNVDKLQEIPQNINETKITEKKKLPNTRKSYLIPPLDKKCISKVKTMTAISVGYTHLSWIKIAIDTLTVLDWNAKPLPQNFWTTLHEPSLLSFAYKTNKSLPESDLYAMETFSMSIKEWERKVNEIHLLSMLIVLIHGINAVDENKTKIVFQEKKVLDKVYEIYIGYERVTTTSIAESILQEVNSTVVTPTNITIDNFNSAVQINSKLIDFYNASKTNKKEDLSLVFLLALSIIQVHFLKIRSINLTSKKFKNKK